VTTAPLTPEVLDALATAGGALDSATARRLWWLGRLLDNAVAVPGTRFRFGIDPLLGLLPVGGDFVAAGLSLYIVHEARRAGFSKRVLTKMLVNVAIDAAAGVVPVLGDLADFAIRANQRNLAMMGIDTTRPLPNWAAVDAEGVQVPPRKRV